VVESGRPEEYARQVVHDERALPQPALWRRAVARFPSVRTAVATAVLVVAAVAGAVAYHRWSTERPEVGIHVCLRPSSPTLAVEEVSAGGNTEWTITFVEGGELRLGLCVWPSHTIELLDVDFPTIDGLDALELVQL